jgi:YfiH family protein
VTSGLDLRSFPFHGAGITAVVTTRHGGVSTGRYASLNLGDHVGDDHAAVMENRRRLADALGVHRLTVADQQHKDRVARVDAGLAGRGHDGVQESVASFPSTDALITDLPGVALTIIVADCAPVVLFDPWHRAVGVAHCGRSGTVLGVLPKTIAAMSGTYGTDPAELLVGIGPAIGPDSYEIGDAQAAQVTAAFGDAGLLKPTRPGHATMDVVGGLRIQLREAGVKSENVHVMNIDTLTSTDDFFSDRAARPCGRFMLAAVLPAEGT